MFRSAQQDRVGGYPIEGSSQNGQEIPRSSVQPPVMLFRLQTAAPCPLGLPGTELLVVCKIVCYSIQGRELSTIVELLVQETIPRGL